MEIASGLAAEMRRVYLFSQLSYEDMDTVAGMMQEIELEREQRLFDCGQPAKRFFLVRSGQIKLYRLSPDGQEKIIAIERPGQTFAEAVMFREHPVYPVSAEALERSVVLGFDNKNFLDILRHNVDTCFRMMATMSMRLHAHVAEIDGLCLHNAMFRLVVYLLHHVPEGADDASQIHLPIPKTALASRLSIQRETLSRLLAQLRDQGLIDVHKQDISIRDLGALRRLTLP